MKFSPENLIKIALAILLVLCLFHMPYGYYQLVRFIAVVEFAFLAYFEYERKNIPLVIAYVALALLFQPLFKVPLGRHVWIIIDILVAAGLIVSVFAKKRKDN
jgi:uncharacterized membrane protein YccC